MKRFDIYHVSTSPYKPSTNGLIERFHRTLDEILGKVVDRAQRNWDEGIPYAVAAYRASVHEVTGYSPNFIVFGRENALPVDLVYGAPTADPSYVSLDEFVAERQRRLRECHSLVRVALGRSAERQKRRYDLTVMT